MTAIALVRNAEGCLRQAALVWRGVFRACHPDDRSASRSRLASQPGDQSQVEKDDITFPEIEEIAPCADHTG